MELVPLPLTVRRVVPESVSVPLVTESVTVSLPAPASTPAMEITLPPLKVNGVSSLVVAVAGRVMTGASSTGVTLTVMELLVVSGPPLPVLPLSFVETPTAGVPLELGVGAETGLVGAGVAVGAGDRVAVAAGEGERRIFVDRRRAGDAVGRGVVDGGDGEGDRLRIGQRTAGAGVAVVVHADVQRVAAAVVRGRRVD